MQNSNSALLDRSLVADSSEPSPIIRDIFAAAPAPRPQPEPKNDDKDLLKGLRFGATIGFVSLALTNSIPTIASVMDDAKASQTYELKPIVKLNLQAADTDSEPRGVLYRPRIKRVVIESKTVVAIVQDLPKLALKPPSVILENGEDD